MMQPFFSVIVVSYNAENIIGATIQSALMQTCSDFEIVIHDGQSNDDTLMRIPKDPRIRIFSEKDSGIYDAMNRAINKSKGKYLIFMNCGDCFYSSNVLADVKILLEKSPSAYAYGNFIRDDIIHIQPNRLTLYYLFRTPLCHQTMFFDGDLMRKSYNYNTDYRILADYDLEFRVLKDNLTINHFDICVCEYEGGGLSESIEGVRIKNIERKIILSNYIDFKHRILYYIKYNITLPKLRTKLMYTSLGPQWMKKIYQRFVNYINTK